MVKKSSLFFLFGTGLLSTALAGTPSEKIDNEILQIAQHILAMPDLSDIKKVTSKLGIFVTPQQIEEVRDSENIYIGKSQDFTFLKSNILSFGFIQDDFKASTFVPANATFVRVWISVKIDKTACPLTKNNFTSKFPDARMDIMHDGAPSVYYLDGSEIGKKVTGLEFGNNGCLLRLSFFQNMNKGS
ncbi:hypothetical protein HSX11_05195 [Oxalobacteraceae bacterium]|nr:hypothetical protein [Oxalobacteraceae bacterium]